MEARASKMASLSSSSSRASERAGRTTLAADGRGDGDVVGEGAGGEQQMAVDDWLGFVAGAGVEDALDEAEGMSVGEDG